ncbi:MAG TPA: dockerin type I repeat-containing protein, partial [Acidobacteriota bacterium]|nr:dockerin type I repeat-containing protein [Acidobacteriota bacterium]
MFLLAILLHSCAVPSAMAAFATGASMQEEDTQICPGDINLDGERGPGDLALLSAHIAGEKILEGEALDNADVNFDFVVDVGDIIRLQEHILGEFPLAPCGDFSPLEVACPGVSLERPSALPLERVGLGTLPEEFSEPTLALVTDTEDELSVLTYVKPEEDGSVTLFTPFYPGASAASGPVKLQITDGTLACPPADFLIEAMPPAPGAYSNVVDALQEMIRVNAQESGLTPQDLLAGNAELPPEAIPLAIAQALVDDPDNPNSLRAISNGTAPFMDGNADNTFLDSSVALLGLAGYVGGDSQAFQSLRQASLVGPSAICGASASLLDGCMKSAAAAEKKLNPPDPGPAVKKLREDFAMTLAAAKFLPRVGKTIKYTHILINHIVKKIKNLQMIALPLAIGKWTAEAKASLLPSILVDLDFEVSPSVMEEDRVEGEWKNSELTAMSKGWKLDARRIAKYALDKLDVKEGLTGGTVVAARKIAEYNGILPHDISNRELEKQLVDLVVEKGREVAPEIFNGESVFEIQPQTSGPVKIDDEEWSRSDVMGVSVAKLSHNKFEPAKVGSATIIVRVRTDGGRFGGAGSISKGKAVEVRQIIMTVSPHQAIARKPGEELPFTVTVKNSFFPKQIKVEALTGSARIKSS